MTKKPTPRQPKKTRMFDGVDAIAYVVATLIAVAFIFIMGPGR